MKDDENKGQIKELKEDWLGHAYTRLEAPARQKSADLALKELKDAAAKSTDPLVRAAWAKWFEKEVIADFFKREMS